MTSREIEKERNHNKKMIQIRQCKTTDTSLPRTNTQKYAYLICQGPLWEDMDAHRGDIQVRVTRSHCYHGKARQKT